jgi:sterol desaturase/sphingolipid hydroxylase (fatty acid hydroxylase superfamily)
VILDTIDSYALPIFFGLLAGDLILRSRGLARAYALPDSICSISMGVFYAVAAAAIRASVLTVFAALHRFAPFDFGLEDGPLTWVAAFVAVDFAFYCFHRTLHEVRVGWAAHVNHHSSTHYNYATAMRQSVFEPFIEPLFMAPLVLIGFDPVLVLACLAVNFAYQFWPHTELASGLEMMGRVLVTPSHHRVHHARNVQYLDKNYGGTLIIWDKLLGTFEPEREAPDYGITHNLTTHNPIRATFHEWIAIARDVAAAANLGARIGYLLRPPGWAPEGARETSRERQRRYLETRNRGPSV